jgi:hypothetical protein
MNYKYISTFYTMILRLDHNMNNDGIGFLPMNQPAYGDVVWVSGTGGTNYAVGDKWLHILDPMDAWVAVIHNGRVYGTLTDISAPSGLFLNGVEFTLDGVPYSISGLNIAVPKK